MASTCKSRHCSRLSRRCGVASAAALLLVLGACSTAEEGTEAPIESEEPTTAAGITDLDGDPEMFDAESGRPAFDEAMRTGCPGTAVGRAQCASSDVENEYLCEYELIDGEGEIRTTTIRRDGDAWSLAETPDHCEPA